MGREVIDLLSTEELDMLRTYIENYAGLDGGTYSMTADIKYVLRFWNEAKNAYLAKIFGDSLILSKDVEYVKSAEMMEDDFRAIFDTSFSAMYDAEASRFIADLRIAYDSFIRGYFEYHDIKDRFPYLFFMGTLTSISTLAKNKITENANITWYFDEGKKLTVRPGDKAIKVIGKFAKMFGIEGFEHFRLVHSRVLNQKKLVGKLCISIHPMDYMTMSDNASGWKSCMSWRNNGEYRQGTVEMMNSQQVVVAYLASEEDMKIYPWGEQRHWNNKKWRQLFIVDPEYIANIKGYPYQNDSLTHEILNWIAELAEKAGMGPYDEIIKNNPYGSIVTNEEEDHRVLFDPQTGLMYNDFDENNDFHFIRLAKSLLNEQCHSLDGYYSGVSECMICGKEGGSVLDHEENRLLCIDCYQPTYCYECGDIIREEDAIWVDDTPLCEYCYADSTAKDCLTGEVHLKDRMTPIYLGISEGTGYYRQPFLYLEKESGIELLEKEFGKKCDVVQGRWENIHYFTNIDIAKFFEFMKVSDVTCCETVEEFILFLKDCSIRPFDSIRR